MKTQLERELSDVLRKQAESTHRVPFTMEEIRGTGARIKRRRAAAAGVGVALAAVVALLGPVMMLGGDRDAGPVPTPPPTSVTTPGGLEAVSGPGVRVELSDAPRGKLDAARKQGLDLNRLIVHVEDIRAVIRAMRTAGAEAVTVNGLRIATATVIRAVGSVVTIGGVPYPQPFVIEAVGTPDRLVRAITRDDYLEHYRDDARELGLGWALEVDETVHASASDLPE